MKEKIETELVKENHAWCAYVVVNGKHSNFALCTDNKEGAEEDKKRIEEGDLHDVIVNAEWYREMKAKTREVPEQNEM